jgi:hypothetical protein
MANPVAVSAIQIEPPVRRAPYESDSPRVSANAPRLRPAYLRLAHESRPDAVFEARARAYETQRRAAAEDRRALEDENEVLRDAGRRKAPASLSFSAQQFAQEGLSPGLHFENYPPAIAAYAQAARHGDPSLTNSASLRILV